MTDSRNITCQVNRRAFIHHGSLFLLAASSGVVAGCRPQSNPSSPVKAESNLRFGLVTDLHYADKEPAGTRFYRESIEKLQAAAVQFQKDQPQFVVELGDLIDAADSVEVEKGYLKRIKAIFASLPGKKHFVLGNHCVNTLSKEEFLAGVGQKKSFYSFDAGNYHFVILDACFREDGQPYGRNNFTWTDSNISVEQIEWLKADLDAAVSPTIVFTHQRLDVSDSHSVKNAVDVRGVLEQSEKVLAVFQGHSHENSHQEISGIHYCVLTAMVEGTGYESNGYATVEILEGDTIKLTGFLKQADYRWPT